MTGNASGNSRDILESMDRPLMNTREVADYLGLKERKIYDLVAKREIPCTRVTGKWLFHRELIDRWLLEHAEGIGTTPAAQPPAIVAGSHDPLLDWAVRESGCGLALLFDGSLDGLARFARGEALACGIHVPDPSGEYNTPLIRQQLPRQPLVALEWAWREQGLILPPGNPRGVRGLADTVGLRFALRQPGAGSRVLLEQLLAAENLGVADLSAAGPARRGELEVGLSIAGNEADVGLGIHAVARQLGLDFVALARERYDIVIRRRDYFEAAFQRLMAFSREAAFREQAGRLAGYDVAGLGTVRYNGP